MSDKSGRTVLERLQTVDNYASTQNQRSAKVKSW